jgi:hypothetical protein
MIFTVDISNKILYITEDINYKDFLDICKKLMVDDEWVVKPSSGIQIPYHPIEPWVRPDTTGTPPWNGPIITYCATY